VNRRARMVFTAAFAVLGWRAAIEATSFPLTGRLMPLLAASALAVFSLFHLVRLLVEEYRERSVPAAERGSSSELAEGASMALGEGHMRTLPPVRAAFGRHLLGWFLGSLVFIALFGTWVGGALFILVFVAVELPKQRWLGPVLVGIALGVVAALVFVLDVDIPESLLLEWLR
jgi:hypothetical protein